MPLRRTHPQSAASRIRQHIETKGECFWKVKDFADFPATAAAQTLSRLTHEGVLQRVGKGIYYHPRMTVLGPSRPSQSALLTHRLKQPLLPAGITAANLLGFSTQNPARPEYATTASSIGALAFGKEPMRVYTRRPETWKHLCPEDAALLDFLRGRGRTSELSDKDTQARLLRLLQNPERFTRLVQVALQEPARVRAMLGAMGQELGMPSALLSSLRGSLNPLSRFDFGVFKQLRHARAWQAK